MDIVGANTTLVDFDSANVKVVTELTPWPSAATLRASINSFGYGGANAHVILDHESMLNDNACANDNAYANDNACANDRTHIKEDVLAKTRRLVLLPFSAHDTTALSSNMTVIENAMSHLPLEDVAYTLTSRRSRFPNRAYSVVDAASKKPIVDSRRSLSTESAVPTCRSATFVFTGTCF
jgi:acyl transferase domain-containing protein